MVLLGHRPSGLLSRAIHSFYEVHEAAKEDQVLRSALFLWKLYPLYSAASHLFSLRYDRYLERRTARLARAGECGARLVLSVGKDKAEEEAWQRELIEAIADALGVLATRVGITLVGEARGEAFLRVRLSRAAGGREAAGPPCDALWARLRPGGAGPLSAVTRVVIDGSREAEDGDKKRAYSLWLVPSGKPKEACDRAIRSLSEAHGGAVFEPHVTVLGNLTGSESEVTRFARRLALETAKMPVRFHRVSLGGVYFRSVILEAERTAGLTTLHARARELLPRSWLPEVLGASKVDWGDAVTRKQGYVPHLSVAYTEAPPPTEAAVTAALPTLLEDASFPAGALALWETDPEDRTCKSWKEIDSFPFQGRPPASSLRLILRLSKFAGPEFLQIGLGTALSLLGGALCEYAFKHDMDLCEGKHVGKGTEEMFHVLLRGLALWGAGDQCLEWSSTIIRNAGTKIGARLKEQLYARLLEQDVKWVNQKGAEELHKTLTERADNIERLFTGQVPEIINMASNLVTNIGMLWLNKPRLCAFGIGMFAFSNITEDVFQWINRLAEDHDRKLEEGHDNALQVLQNFRTIRAFGCARKEQTEFSKNLRKGLQFRCCDGVEKLVEIFSWASGEFTFQLAYVYGAMLATAGFINKSEVRDSVVKCFRASRPLYQLKYRMFSGKSTFTADAEAVLEALERPPEIPFEDEALYNPDVSQVRGEVEATTLNFSYKDDESDLQLKKVSFRIPAGSSAGLVGPSGCGKSTLFNLLLRFYDPTGGSLKIDGVELSKWNPQALYRAVAWVSQDNAVFEGTVLDNIRFGNPDASEAEVVEAMKQAALYDDVLKKEKGVLAKASQLSGGQKQRLSIARSLLRNPRILLLDEATSALDTASERKVQKALDELMKGRTVIAIAHRLSTIMGSDKILVMENGEIIEQGTHVELLHKSGGKYADLVQQQLAVDDDSAKAETPADPAAIKECELSLTTLLAEVPEKYREKVEKAQGSLKEAAKALQQEKKRLALKESMMGSKKPWQAARRLTQSIRAVIRMQAMVKETKDRSNCPVEQKLSRAISKASELAEQAEDADTVQLASLARAASSPT